MTKKITIIFVAILLFGLSSKLQAQLQTFDCTIIDTKAKFIPNGNDVRRSADNPTSCTADTLDFARFRASSLQTVTMYDGRGLGQFYGAPQRITLHGATFFAFIAGTPTPLTTTVYVNLYRADADSLPTGAPLRSDTITVDSTFGNGQLVILQKNASFNPIDIDFDYIIAVESAVSDTFNVAVVANNWNNRDGRGAFFNVGSINNVWYRGRNLNIANVAFDADMLINPHVSYKIGTDFDIVSQCFNVGDTVNFVNKSSNSVLSSPFYNRWAYSNQEQFSHMWNYGVNPFTGVYLVDAFTTYFNNQVYDVRLASRVLQWTGNRYCNDTTIKTLYPKPFTPSINGGGIKCEADQVVLFTNTAKENKTKWVINRTDTTGFAFSDTLIINNLMQDTFLYARVSNGVCLSEAGAVGMQVFAYPNIPIARNDSVCANSRANLSAFSPNALTITWFRDSSMNFPFFNGNVFQTQPLNNDTFYYVRASNFNCQSEGFVRVEALVGQDFAPVEPTATGDTSICLTSNAAITFEAQVNSSDQLRWFNVPSGGNPVATGSTFIFNPTQRGDFFFYVEAWNGTCASSRIAVKASIDQAPPLSNASGDEVCFNSNAQINASVPYGSITWFSSPTGGVPIGFGNQFNYSLAKNDTTFYAERSSGICVAPIRTPVKVIVNIAPDFSSLTGDTICSRGSATLKGFAPSGTIQWYENETDITPIGTGNFFKTPILLGNKNYYAAVNFKGCIGPKNTLTTRVNPRPFSGFFYDVLNDQRIQLTPLTTAGVTFNWNFGDGNNSFETSPTHKYTDSGFFDVRLILTSMANQCKDTTVNIVYIPFADPASTQLLSIEKLSIYPNPSKGQFYISGSFLKGNLPLTVFDINGKIVVQENMIVSQGTPYIFNINQKPGIYIIQVGQYYAKLILED